MAISSEHCWLQPEPSNEIRLFVRDYAHEHKLVFNNLVR
jgi:23S rRNA (uracil1939-C5)-methyltransferase